jgi:hypothetical protein
MRKLAYLLFLLPLTALWIVGCDDTNPVAPESATAATTQEASFAKKPPPEPPAPSPGIIGYVTVQSPVKGSGYTPAFMEVSCPTGMVPLHGGYEIEPRPGDVWPAPTLGQSFEIVANRPTHRVESDGSITGGWRVGILGMRQTNTPVPFQFYTWAGCVEAQ